MLPRREVCPTIIRRHFNAVDFEARVASGDLRRIVSRSYPTPVGRGQPPGTVSQLIEYVRPDGAPVARAFRYVTPDGRIGASGREDPKWLRVGDEVLIPVRDPLHVCVHCARR